MRTKPQLEERRTELRECPAPLAMLRLYCPSSFSRTKQLLGWLRGRESDEDKGSKDPPKIIVELVCDKHCQHDTDHCFRDDNFCDGGLARRSKC